MTVIVTLPANVPVGTRISVKTTKNENVFIESPLTMIYKCEKINDMLTEIEAVKNKNNDNGEMEYRKLLEEKG
jgi:hypothetical protein